MIRWIFIAHVAFGLVALLVFAIPLLARKGGKVHVRTGWAYVWSMIGVGLTALLITPWRIFFDPERSAQSAAFAVFLLFIALFTLAAIWYGIRVLRFKSRVEPERSVLSLGPPGLVIFAAFGTQLIGFKLGDTLLMAFPFLALVVSISQLRYWLSAQTTNRHWWFAHLDGMIVACISTITAFLVTALPRLTSASIARSPVLWIAPGLVLGSLATLWKRRELQKSARN